MGDNPFLNKMTYRHRSEGWQRSRSTGHLPGELRVLGSGDDVSDQFPGPVAYEVPMMWLAMGCVCIYTYCCYIHITCKYFSLLVMSHLLLCILPLCVHAFGEWHLYMLWLIATLFLCFLAFLSSLCKLHMLLCNISLRRFKKILHLGL